MSVRKILNASSGYTASTATVSGPSDASFGSTSLLLTGDPSVVDPNFANVSLLLTGNDLLDKSNNKVAVTVNGNAVVSNTKKKFGTGSYYFDGTGDTLTFAANSVFLLNGDFTIESWVYPTAQVQSYPSVFTVGKQFGQGENIIVYFNHSANLSKYLVYFNSTLLLTGTIPKSLNLWHHVALVKSGSTVSLYVDGILDTSATYSSTTFTANPAACIGSEDAVRGITDFTGYIDDLRITKGVARYTTNFTPPVQALPSHEILDSSVYSIPITTYGNARIDTTTKKYGTGSMYFDGNGDCLAYLTNNSTTINGTEDFTIEAWLNPNLANGYHCFYSSQWAIQCYMTSSRVIEIYLSSSVSSGSYFVVVSSTGAISLNQWSHIAITRNGSNIRIFINGVLDGTPGSTTGSIGAGTSASIGSFNSSTQYAFSGYIDDLRITKGTARYTANFTPPTAALPTIPPTIAADPWWVNVSLLLDGNTTDAYDPHWQNVSLMLTGDDFIDWSNNHYTVTKSGAIATDNTIKKYNSGSIKITTADTDFATANTGSSLGSSNFTIEFWFSSLSTSGYCAPFMVDNTAGGYAGITFTRSGAFLSTTGTSWEMFGYGSTQATASFDGNWHHVALCRSTVSVYLFIDGVSVGAPYNISTNSITATPAGAVLVGKQSTSTGFTGNIADFRITKGVARYTANFTRPTAALPSYKIQDRTQNNLTLTPYGNVQLSTDVKKNGTGSMFFDGTGDYVNLSPSSNLNFGTGDFTVEGWMYKINNSTDQAIVTLQGSTSNFYVPVFYGGSGGVGTDKLAVQSGSSVITSSSTAFPLNQWVHFAIIRSSGTITIYQNGVSVGSAAGASDYIGTLNYAYVGAHYIGGTAYYPYLGYIDDLRITKGYARYTQNFTPPSQSFATQYISTGFDPNYADVSLLLTGEGTNGSTTFTDLSSSPKTITNNGSVSVNTSVKKFGTGSIAFSGSNNLDVTSPSTLSFGTGDFTVEFWFYATSSASYDTLFSTTINYSGSVDLRVNTNGASRNIQVVSNNSAILTGNTAFTLNTWNHLVIARSGTILNLYLNGNNVGTTTSSHNFVSDTFMIGAIGAGYKFSGYMDDFRITKGVARYTTNFTPPTYALATTTGTPFDVNRADTSLLLRGNGTNGSTSFTDESPNNLTVTNNGSVTVNTTTKKYGTGSMAFSGSNYLSIPNSSRLVFGAGDFTVEAWINLTSIPGANVSTIAGVWDASTGYGWIIQTDPSMLRIVTTGLVFTSASWAPATNIWYHIAVSRSSGSIRIFVNGTQIGTTATVTGDIQSTFTLNIGMNRDGGNSSLPFNGYVDDLRITKGYARYTANFTPPTYEDPIATGTQYDVNYAQVSLLLNGDGTNGSTTFTDLSSGANPFTVAGGTQINTTTKKYGTGSLYFNGSNSCITAPTSSNFAFGTGDFTVEYWIYYTSTTTSYGHCVLDTRTSNGNATGIAFSTMNNGAAEIYTSVELANAGTAAINTWNHYAFVRRSGVLVGYINGVSVFSIAFTQNLSDTTCVIGSNNPRNTWAAGYIDDLRITKGLARYTTNFTPPTAPLPTSGGY